MSIAPMTDIREGVDRYQVIDSVSDNALVMQVVEKHFDAPSQRFASSQSLDTVFQFLVVVTTPRRRSRKVPVYFVSA